MSEKENKQKIKEIIKQALTKSSVEEINSAEYIQTRKPVAPINNKVKND
jgi:hypothetical protein